jgi:diguanylate cyclase (GGDEF)-like protein
VSRRHAYSVVGAFLSLGAPFGLLAVQAARAQPVSWDWLLRELVEDAVVFGYVGLSTMVAFTVFAYALGRQADQLATLAGTDPLTGLLNRRAFEDRLKEEWARAIRYGTPLSLLLLDLDGLKELNDREGHRQGDMALRDVAFVLRAGCRTADIAARWGGDEFSVLAPATDRAEAFELADRVRASASETPTARTVSIGVATLDRGQPGAPEALVCDADRALYAAKKLGRNRVVAC